MSSVTYRIAAQSVPRRLFALSIAILIPAIVLVALDRSLVFDFITGGETEVVPVDPIPPEVIDEPPQLPPDPSVDGSDFQAIEPPVIVVDGDTGNAITALPTPETQAGFVSTNRLPIYPETAKQNCEQGRVGLSLRIGADGRVIDASIANSSGYPTLDDAALRAARSWRFTPAQLGGKAVESTATKTVIFNLRNEIGLSMTEREVRECLNGG